MVDELIDRIGEEGNVIGTIMKHTAHREGILHRNAHVWIYNSKGEILLQKRAKDKEDYPNRLDISAAGHIGAGESPEKGALREIKEEIGLEVFKEDLIFIGNQKSNNKVKENFIDYEFRSLYLYKWEGELEDLELQIEEVSHVKLVSLKYFKENCLNEELFVPHKEEYYNFIIKEIEKKLETN